MYAYDAAGRLQGVTDAALNATTTFERDAAGRVTKTTDALGHETHTSYKSGGRLASTTNARGKTATFNRTPTSATITDGLSHTTVTSLTTYGLPQATVYPGGADTSSNYLGTTRLDGSQSFPTSFDDELNRTRNYGYDSKSGLTSATDLSGQSWQYQYTPRAGAAISYDVFSGSVSTANYDGGASAYQGSGGGTEYRDVSTVGSSNGGNFTHLLSQVTSPMGEVTKFERGTNGRISKVTYPDSGTKTITYDADARPQQIVLPQGTVVTLSHDISGRETHRETDTGEFRDLTYGPNDRIETMTDNTGATTYSYDEAGRFSGITYPSGASVMYTRDKLDRTTDVRVKPKADAAEIVTHYDYDPNGNLAQIIDPNNGVTGFSYDDADRLTQRVLPNGVVTSYGYDSRDRVTSVVHRNASNAVLASVVYERSPSGEPTKITREDGTYTTVEYDAALRISKESEFDANDVLVAEASYGYDLDGNRTSKTTLTGSETYSYAANFKVTGISGTSGNETYTHDAGGRLIGVTRGGVSREIEYDSMDHVTRAVDGGVEVERYTFDGEGRRVGVTTGTSAKKFLIAPNLGEGYESPQAVTDASGGLVAAFVYAGEHPIAKITPSGVEYFLTDSMGSVIAKADSAGAATATIKYDGFGEVESAVGASSAVDPSVGAEPRFQGMTLDSTTGLYFVRARSYDSRTGRFVSRDPLDGAQRRPETMNTYVLDLSNPHLSRDPTGEFDLMELSIGAAVTTVLAAIAIPRFTDYLRQARAVKAGSFIAGSNESLRVEGYRMIKEDLAYLDQYGPNSDQGRLGNYLAYVGYGVAAATGDPPVDVPLAPHGASVEYNIMVTRLTRYDPEWYYKQIKKGGPWDYKQQGIEYEDFGNFNFGATCRAMGLPLEICERGAGWAQRRDNKKVPEESNYWYTSAPYGDDPMDQLQIQDGYNYGEYWEAHALGL